MAAVFDAMAAAATGEKEGGDKGVGASQDQFAHDEMHLDGGDHDCLPRESSPRDGSGGDSGDASEHAVVKVDDDDSAPMPDTSQSVPSQQEITRNMLRRQVASPLPFAFLYIAVPLSCAHVLVTLTDFLLKLPGSR